MERGTYILCFSAGVGPGEETHRKDKTSPSFFLGVECTGDGDELEEKLDGGWGVSMSVSQGEEISSCTEN